VTRGFSWQWGDQDGGVTKGCIGRVQYLRKSDNIYWVQVEWIPAANVSHPYTFNTAPLCIHDKDAGNFVNSCSNGYRWTNDGVKDIKLYPLSCSFNRAHREVRLGSDSITYYCGIIKDSDSSQCGPSTGDQCKDCRGLTIFSYDLLDSTTSLEAACNVTTNSPIELKSLEAVAPLEAVPSSKSKDPQGKGILTEVYPENKSGAYRASDLILLSTPTSKSDLKASLKKCPEVKSIIDVVGKVGRVVEVLTNEIRISIGKWNIVWDKSSVYALSTDDIMAFGRRILPFLKCPKNQHSLCACTELPPEYQSGLETYPNRVLCDECFTEDIENLKIFYHCSSCEYDVCLNCAITKAERVYESSHPVRLPSITTILEYTVYSFLTPYSMNRRDCKICWYFFTSTNC
jgi:hypothetical protein